MTLRFSFLSFFLMCTILLVSGAVHSGVEFSDKDMQTLAKGGQIIRPLAGSGKKSRVAGSSYAVINAPPDVVWRALNDVSAWPNIFYNTFGSKVVSAKGNVKIVKMLIGNNIITLSFYFITTYDQKKWEMRYVLNKKAPHDIEDARGWVRLFPQPGGRTLVAFSSTIKLPLGMLIALMGDKVLGWIEYRLLSVPKRLKGWVEGKSGAKYRVFVNEIPNKSP